MMYFRTELGREPHVKTAANLFKTITYRNKDRLTAGLIIGGYDPYDGGQIYEITLGGTLTRQKYALSGSGSGYIYGLIDASYRDGMSKQECQELVKKVISHAISRDGSSGGVIRLVTIDQSGVEKEVVPGDGLPYFA
jgi:20S proteasome subunit beta 1